MTHWDTGKTRPDVDSSRERGTGLRHTEVRLYQSVRSAHLERAHQLRPATIIYGEKRYDFDETLCAGLELVPGTGLAAARWLWQHPPETLEVNEPLMLESALWTAVCLAAVRLRQRLGGPTVRVVSYAIENRDPFESPAPAGLRSRARRAMERLASRFVWNALDRIAYGTAAAQQLYLTTFRPANSTSKLIWALPAAQAGEAERTRRALFVSAFSPRKGIPELISAWPLVRAAVDDATLVLIGKGALAEKVAELAEVDDSVRLLVDPPRSTITDELAGASVLVLPSQPTETWREQVGLPIVEGLSTGCTVVTTDQTGLADWLDQHGHHVLTTPTQPEALASALIEALSHPLEPDQVRASLPQRDGRLAADDWMMADAAT